MEVQHLRRFWVARVSFFLMGKAGRGGEFRGLERHGLEEETSF